MSGETRAPMAKLGRGVCLRAPENASGRTSRRARHRCAAMRDGPPQWIRDRRSGNAAGSPQSNAGTRSLCPRREAGQPRCPGGESLLRFSLGRLRLPPPFNNFRARGMIDRAIPVARFRVIINFTLCHGAALKGACNASSRCFLSKYSNALNHAGPPASFASFSFFDELFLQRRSYRRRSCSDENSP